MIRFALLLALVAPTAAQHAVNPERSTDRPIDDVAPATPLAIYGGVIYEDGQPERPVFLAPFADGSFMVREYRTTGIVERWGSWGFLGTVVGETPTPILGFQAAGWRAWAPFHPLGFSASWSCNEGRRGALDARLLWCGGGASSALLPGLLDLAR